MMTALWEAGYRVNYKRVARLMKELSIQFTYIVAEQ